MMDSRALAIALAAGFGVFALLRSQQASAADYEPQQPQSDANIPPDIPDWDYAPDVSSPPFAFPQTYPDFQTPPYVPVQNQNDFNVPAQYTGWSTFPFAEIDDSQQESSPVAPSIWGDDWGNVMPKSPDTNYPALQTWPTNEWDVVPPGSVTPTDSPYGDIGYGEFWRVLTQTPPAALSFMVTPWNEPVSPTLANEHPNVRAFLYAIRVGEGTGDAEGYRRLVGGGNFDSFADHPKALGWPGFVFTNSQTGKRDLSTAAGAYQIVFTGSNPARPQWPYYRGVLGLPDFSPGSQDRFAINFLRETGAYDSIRTGNFTDALNRAKSRWASLPGAGYGQREESLAAVAQYYRNYGGVFSQNNALAMAAIGVRA